ncbi:hypothetical protein OA860_03415 [Prochlorococcus sp. AH-716-E13]|nr:hypothetical protein [Prochlorococcus sp. AH-716-E13]
MINLKKANIFYNFLLLRQNRISSKYINLLKKKPYLLVCNIFDRHTKPSCINALDTMFQFGIKGKELDTTLLQTLDKSQLYAYKLGCFLSMKVHYQPNLIFSLLKSIIRYLFKLIFSLSDIVYTIFYSIFYVNFKTNNRIRTIALKGKKEKLNLYTISYWKSKKNNSIYHYYPDADSRKNDYFIATEFPEFNSIGIGLKNCKKNIYKSLDFLSNKDIIISIFLLIESYLFDFFGSYKKTYGSCINNLIKLSFLNRRFLYILNYQSSNKIINFLNLNSIIIWSENQNDSKLFSTGLIQNSSKKTNTKIISYLGCTTFSSNYHKQFVPLKYELDLGVWGKKIFMLHDQQSIDEFRTLLNKNFEKNNFKYIKIRKGLQRFKFNNLSINSIDFTKRDFTFITHGTDNEFLQVLKMLLSNESKIFKNIKKSSLFVRLHPSLSLSRINNIISLLNKDSKYKPFEIKIIDNKNESLIETLYKSNYNIFGDSSLINIALALNLNVISVRTSFLYQAPIQGLNMKNKNLTFI